MFYRRFEGHVIEWGRSVVGTARLFNSTTASVDGLKQDNKPDAEEYGSADGCHHLPQKFLVPRNWPRLPNGDDGRRVTGLTPGIGSPQGLRCGVKPLTRSGLLVYQGCVRSNVGSQSRKLGPLGCHGFLKSCGDGPLTFGGSLDLLYL